MITKRRRQNKVFVFWVFFSAILLDFSLTDIEVGFALMPRCIWSEIALGVAWIRTAEEQQAVWSSSAVVFCRR